MNEKQLAGYIDHTLLRPTAISDDIKKLCDEAKRYGFYSVSVNQRWIGLATELLHGSIVKVGSVISLPFGTDSTKAKVEAVRDAIFSGADEIDMVADLAAIIENNDHYLAGQFRQVSKVCRSMRPAVILKVIIEAAALTEQQKRLACEIADRCKVDFIKTSTGFHPAGGATIEDIKLIKQMAPHCKVKAAGGIKTYQQAIEMLTSGADRIGTSSSVKIIEQFRAGQSQ